jgi:hypothetical protein
MANKIRGEIGIGKTFELFKSNKQRIEEVLSSDALNPIRQAGLSEQDIEGIVERIAFGETMAKYLVLEKAIEIRTSFSEEIASVFFPKLFPTFEELDTMPGGYLPNLKTFLTRYVELNCQTKIEIGEIIEDEAGFTVEITDCKFAQIAEIMGDREICYWTSCVTDLKFFPVQAERAGINFNRGGTIASGQKVCDFCWRK